LASLTLVIEAREVSGEEAGELSVLGLGFEEADVDVFEDCGAPTENEQAPAINARDRPTRVTRAVRTRKSSM
jgi:hypothetical protein